MRTTIINVILFGGIGAYLSYLGHKLNAWPFWVVIVAMSLVQINNGLD